ncbi:H/ACA ribonucleoprotein complex subunit 3-like [Arvicola amphibius]|uniref:H/ACA ribonucleoprotein complex subunit 3-like n=1 Tax=Arvicola amphibius TaxID=1047088 RepID=UPI0018E36F25|nr:H/ACA ribonucleoprotein complex subunit 3-like [Arvicola amphibius]
MFLQYYLNKQGDCVYMLKKFDPMRQQTCSAHPARLSPDEKYSRHRITIKKRFKVLMIQQLRSVL